MRLLNALIGLGQPLGLTPGKLNVEKIKAKAMRNTGVEDFGDTLYVPGMNQLFETVNDAPLTSFGQLSTNEFGVEALSNRLRQVDYLKRHPEVQDIKIDRPIFIVGFPRSGTTLLQNLLALSDDRRALPFWEITNPIPLSDNLEKDIPIRQRRTKRRLAVANFVVPEMKFIHEVKYDSYEECWPLMISQFTVLNWDMSSRWTSYGEWMMKQDLTASYKEYKKFLQVMVNRVPNKKLVLKCPDHLWFLDKVLEVFPDACIIWAHRDPCSSIPSYCSLASLHWRLLYGKYDPKEIGPYIEERFYEGIERALKVRERLGDQSFFDVNFNDLHTNPGGVINNITDKFNLGRIDESVLNKYLNTDRTDQKGNHTYSAERYGLNLEEIRNRFGAYIDRFNIPAG